MRSLFLTAALALLARPAIAGDIAVTATAVPLNAKDLQQMQVDSLQFVAGFALTSTTPEWGGYSGMVLSDDGSTLVAISDIGHWLRLELTHDAGGKLTGIGAARTELLLDEAGQPVAGKEWSDAEGISAVPDGGFIVSFERNHRLWRYAAIDGVPSGAAVAVTAPGETTALPENSGIEALLAGDKGELTLLAEGGAVGGASRGWRQHGAEWQPLRIERSDGFEPTDLAAAGDGQLALLERRYTEQDGPAARISLLTADMSERPQAAYTLAVLRLPLSVDNFECIAVRPSPSGGRYVYLLSDNNQNLLQRTLLLQFLLPAGVAQP
jgi:hypothetical protein